MNVNAEEQQQIAQAQSDATLRALSETIAGAAVENATLRGALTAAAMREKILEDRNQELAGRLRDLQNTTATAAKDPEPEPADPEPEPTPVPADPEPAPRKARQKP